jgi:hypothetical protein
MDVAIHGARMVNFLRTKDSLTEGASKLGLDSEEFCVLAASRIAVLFSEVSVTFTQFAVFTLVKY